MKITAITIHHFAGLHNVNLKFTDGLNVILGRNEAGKSTIFYALQHVLFTKAKLTKPEFKKELGKWIPLRGDTASVDCEFTIGDQGYKIGKSWGPAVRSLLKKPDGSIVNDDKTVHEMMSTLIPASIGTFRSTLMTYQMGLHKTFVDIPNESPETITQLGDVLRNAVMNTDGVSIDELNDKVRELEAEYLSRWDWRNNRPEDGKDIANPWKKEVGRVLKAYYALTHAKKFLDEVKRFEYDYDAVNKKISAAAQTMADIDIYLRSNREIVKDAQERRVIVAEEKTFTMESELLKAANSDWPVQEHKVVELKNGLPVLDEAIQALKNEYALAKDAELRKSLVEAFTRLETLKGAMDSQKTVLDAARAVTKNDCTTLARLEKEKTTWETRISGGALRMTITGKTTSAFTLQTDVNDPSTEHITPGMEIEIEAGGRIQLALADFDIQVTSGEGNIDEAIAAYKRVQSEMHTALDALGVASEDEAVSLNSVYESAKTGYENARKNFMAELGTRDYTALEKEAKKTGVGGATRPSTDVFVDLKKQQDRAEEMKRDITRSEETIARYTAKYTSHDDLMGLLAENITNIKRIGEQLRALAPLPEHITDIEAYLKEFADAEKKFEASTDEHRKLSIEKARMDGAAPETSSEEQELHLEALTREYTSEMAMAAAILRLKTVVDELSAELDGSTYDGLEQEVTRTIALLTSGRYTKLRMDKALPDAFITNDSLAIPGDFLSTGTKDVMGMAMRLAMAKYFLGASDGFVAMDDPCVNLDADRKQQAALLLQAFSEHKQTIVFTCHEEHAALFGGNCIRLA